ncbi:pupal cuticle protein Edg-84A-like [Macrobrachium nipponense]|uniref:pupal cuticle protein Edg-84A-like n=1 Tax=Macrobrachium nipponense TaxID=159736 RepID=UPI0030C8C450
MKVLVFLCLVGLAVSARRLTKEEEAKEMESFDPYNFNVVVNDDENTVYSARQESQDSNGAVQGQYSWIAADGTRYIVTYTADPVNGYNAVTKQEKTNVVVRMPVPRLLVREEAETIA